MSKNNRYMPTRRRAFALLTAAASAMAIAAPALADDNTLDIGNRVPQWVLLEF